MDDDDELGRRWVANQSDLELTVRTTAGETKTVKLTKERSPRKKAL